MARPDPPNEAGKWTLIAQRGPLVLWRRDRLDPTPGTLFYLMNLPRQPELFYDEATALRRLDVLGSNPSEAAA